MYYLRCIHEPPSETQGFQLLLKGYKRKLKLLELMFFQQAENCVVVVVVVVVVVAAAAVVVVNILPLLSDCILLHA